MSLCFSWNFYKETAAAKSLQSCPTLCDPIDGSPPGSSVPGILQARTLEWVAIFFSIAWKWKVKVKSLSRIWPSATPWTAAYQALPSMGFSKQEYWSGVPLPSPQYGSRTGINSSIFRPCRSSGPTLCFRRGGNWSLREGPHSLLAPRGYGCWLLKVLRYSILFPIPVLLTRSHSVDGGNLRIIFVLHFSWTHTFF